MAMKTNWRIIARTSDESPTVGHALVENADQRTVALRGGCSAMIEPIHKFDVAMFKKCHGEGATIEFENGTTHLTAFNNQAKRLMCWVMGDFNSVVTAHGDMEEFHALIAQPDMTADIFPKIGDKAGIALKFPAVIGPDLTAQGDLSIRDVVQEDSNDTINDRDDDFLVGERVDNLSPDIRLSQLGKLAVFKLLFPQTKDTGSGRRIRAKERLGSFVVDPTRTTLTQENSIGAVMRLSTVDMTFEAEMAALAHLTRNHSDDPHNGPSEKSLSAFKYILDFDEDPEQSVDVTTELPHMKEPWSNGRLPASISGMFRKMNTDHIAAFDGLQKIPHGIAMVAGCPGAGKTFWNVNVASLAMAGPRLRPGGRHTRVRVLYLVDMNSPVNDVANRIVAALNQAGLKKKVVRLYTLPTELKNGTFLGENKKPAARDADDVPDFTKLFIRARPDRDEPSSKAKARIGHAKCLAPSLDEAAWDHYLANINLYQELKDVMAIVDSGSLSKGEAKLLRRLVFNLYRDVLRAADFIAATPVAASKDVVVKCFRPDLVILDEAPHARELTALIPIAWFTPIAWILTGDYRQTRPYVVTASCEVGQSKGLIPNPYADQLRVTAMERAEKSSALKHQLLTNHRAYGGLHKLPSKLFYEGKMRSGIEENPETVKHVMAYLKGIAGGKTIKENRLIVHFERDRAERVGTSYSNPAHVRWVMTRIMELMRDPKFLSLDGKKPGRILVISPYGGAVAAYAEAFENVPPHMKYRISATAKNPDVEVRTIDTAQGHEADLVFVDFVRTHGPGFCDDPNRLCVGITRARQGEIILMNRYMCKRRNPDGRLEMTKYLAHMWSDLWDKDQIVLVKARADSSSKS